MASLEYEFKDSVRKGGGKRFCITCPIIVIMAVACLASIAIFAGGMAALYGLDWYKNKRRQNRKLTKKLIERDGTTKEEEQQSIAEQSA